MPLTAAKGEPIPIPCEGSDVPGHVAADPRFAMCKMCGWLVTRDTAGNVGTHHRDDILARLERGDFDGG